MGNKIITIKGGLGNQLFQYAYGLKLSLVDKKEVIFDTSFFIENTQDTSRPFLLNNFNISPNARFEPVHKNFIHKTLTKIYKKITGNYGFYQNEKYFIEIEKEIRKHYTLKNPLSPASQTIVNTIQTFPNTVSIHVRRGDYVQDTNTNKHHGVCDLQYYTQAIDYAKSHLDTPKFFIFSDDIDWVKENLHIDTATYVSNPSIPDYEELILMSTCKHNIIANSTFSWWAAYLNANPNKIVLAPKQWTSKKSSNELDILPKTWIQI